MPIAGRDGTKRRTDVSDGGGWNVSSAWSTPEEAGVKNAATTSASAALEFHHRDSRTKAFGLGNFSGSWERLAAEAAKCDLLCANCQQTAAQLSRVDSGTRQKGTSHRTHGR
jgi:hypothetical protein